MVVDSALEEYEGQPGFPRAARQFLLKWSFYSSMVIRDLTLRSAASFGSFHLIRLLYDEYMFFIVEHKVAEATQTTPMAVMGKTDRMVRHFFSMFIGSTGVVSEEGNWVYKYVVFIFTAKSYTRYWFIIWYFVWSWRHQTWNEPEAYAKLINTDSWYIWCGQLTIYIDTKNCIDVYK